MSKYVDVIAVRFDREESIRLFTAPWYSRIDEGSTVLCQLADYEKSGVVVASASTIDMTSDVYTLLKKLTDVPEEEDFGKVIAVFERRDLDYDA